jgi:hypothetical protein
MNINYPLERSNLLRSISRNDSYHSLTRTDSIHSLESRIFAQQSKVDVLPHVSLEVNHIVGSALRKRRLQSSRLVRSLQGFEEDEGHWIPGDAKRRRLNDKLSDEPYENCKSERASSFQQKKSYSTLEANPSEEEEVTLIPPPAPTSPKSNTKRRKKKKPIESEKDGIKTRFINKRVAKYFNGELFFGTVTEYDRYWRICYDDDDAEDMNKKELIQSLDLYSKMCSEDPKNMYE